MGVTDATRTAAPPRTLTVRLRLRTLLVALAVAALAGSLGAFALWASGLAPLTSGSSTFRPLGTAPLAHTDDPMDTGQPVYRWRPGATYTVGIVLENTASLPITITGVDSTGAGWEGAARGPRPFLYRRPDRFPGPIAPFHPIHLGAGDSTPIALVYHANPNVCGAGARGATFTIDDFRLHFTVLGVFHDSQSLPLGRPFSMEVPVKHACR